MPKPKKYQLVVARPCHIPDIVKIAMNAFKEGPEGSLPISKEKISDIADLCVRSPHQLALVAVSNGNVKGVFIGHVDSHAYCDGLVASDLINYVKPSLRGTDCAERFVEAFDAWCGRIPNLIGASLSLSRLNATTPYMDALFKKYGFSRTGVDYMKLREL